MSGEIGVERPELRRATLKRCEHESSFAATQVHDLRTKPVGQPELVSESRMVHRSSERKNKAVIHRGAADHHDHTGIPLSRHCETA
jgi:hypothetical protein